jgi:hypothetical protein
VQLDFHPGVHLTYCTKVHPGHGWDHVFPSLQTCVPDLKARLCPEAPFGLGLRLSSMECDELLAEDRLCQFKDFLTAHDLYVFTLNGFPYGAFHGSRVKADVFAPDWQDKARLSYTLRLAKVLSELLPPDMEGGISTLPLSYKPWNSLRNHEAMIHITRNLILLVKELIDFKERSGTFIHLDLEPEPDGLVETTTELVEFYQEWLLPYGGLLLADTVGLSTQTAHQTLLEHIQVCLDTCHLAVTYEDPQDALKLLVENGIRVGKVQITNGWRAVLGPDKSSREQLSRELTPFSSSPYLHQVVGRREDGSRVHYRDLGEALPYLPKAGEYEWRIHYHLPMFVERFGSLETTRNLTQEVLELLGSGGFTKHLELETYTWEQLPAALKLDLVDSLELEYRWVLETLAQTESAPWNQNPGSCEIDL